MKVLTSSQDGLVRAAVIKTPTGQLERPINKLIYLPQHDQTSVDHPIKGGREGGGGGGLLRIANINEFRRYVSDLLFIWFCIFWLELVTVRLVRQLTHMDRLALRAQPCVTRRSRLSFHFCSFDFDTFNKRHVQSPREESLFSLNIESLVWNLLQNSYFLGCGRKCTIGMVFGFAYSLLWMSSLCKHEISKDFRSLLSSLIRLAYH